MAGNPNRFSAYSNVSKVSARSFSQPPTQVSTQTLLNALHTSYTSSKPYVLESSTSLVVNSWLTASSEGGHGRPAGTVDGDLARRAWEHARRRAEDGCVVLSSLHESTPSVFAPFVSTLPLSIPDIFYTALDVLRPFVQCVTPQNATALQYSSFAATFTLSLNGNLTQAELKISTSGIDTNKGLLQLPADRGFRAFDVFYYLLSSASTSSEREFLGLEHAASYDLLKKTDTYDPPAYLPTADDTAAAEEFRNDLKAIGISGSARRDLLSVLAALLKLGNTLRLLVDDDVLNDVCEDVGGLLGVEPEVLARQCDSRERETLIGAIYEALVDWVVQKANDAIAAEIRRERMGGGGSDSSGPAAHTPRTNGNDEDTVNITVLEIPSPSLGKAAALRTVFDDSQGINAEMKEDGVAVVPAGHSTIGEMRAAVTECEYDLGITTGHAGREREYERDRRENVLHKVGHETEHGGFLSKLLFPLNGQDITLGKAGRFDLSSVISSSRVWFHLSLHPTDESPSRLAATQAAWSAGSPSRQLRAWRLPEWANRRNKLLDFTADFDADEFCTRYAKLGCKDGKDGIESFVLERGWSNGEIVIGHERIWIRESAWWEAESMLDLMPAHASPGSVLGTAIRPLSGYRAPSPGISEAYFGPFGDNNAVQSRDSLLLRNQSSATLANRSVLGARSLAPTMAQTVRSTSGGDYGLGTKGDDKKGEISYLNDLDPELTNPNHIIQEKMKKSRRLWITLVWALTFWIPSFVLRYAGIMKRPDVRMAWREKLVLIFFIFLLNAFVVFYIVGFGLVLCPNYNKAWNNQEVSYHQGANDFWVSVHGKVYDISSFWTLPHSNIIQEPVTPDVMQPLAGLNCDNMFPLPLNLACPDFVTSPSLALTVNVTNNPTANLGFIHVSGSQSPFSGKPLANINWYADNFLPRMKEYYIGNLVTAASTVASQGKNEQYEWVIINGQVYDLSNYFYTLKLQNNLAIYKFLPSTVQQIIEQNPGRDVSNLWASYKASNPQEEASSYYCLNNMFYVGIVDFRQSARCQVNNYILLAFTIILCAVILVKFLAALQLGSKRRPAAQDKFIICQVPCYTEGEDHLRKGLDSLTALAYDNKRKLICVICDGMIVGGGNDRPTPKIVLDILGVDPKIDPPALPFKSVGAGSEQLNYGKVYSGLYEYEGNVVPYIVIVKVGKESEQKKSKPGNRGKRDSQILLMSFLNRVHHRSPMSPLELEMFHQINNIIGVDPELYEYLFMVDADTMVKEDSLNRLVASCANDAKIAGICGETSLENEERSWWTMIQVYEYYISHHLAKAFESLFGSVTCLPGCFCMYRLRTADKGKPLIISDKVLEEYSDCQVDTLHKKNLLALGEDRYLTTLMTKHFPHMSYKFVPDAYAQTAAPEKWSILLSQRRRWINSTIHNLAELVFIKDMCGFCCFSMRFVVFIDLFGTLILPATCCYLGYLIYRVASHTGQFPLISIVMIAAVYGLQAVIFIIKRQWQHVGWMIIYIIAFPIYSFVLPIYAFWKQDDFSWGNTRIVIGEKGDKQIIAVEDEGFDPRSIPLQRWDDYATANNLPGRRGLPIPNEKEFQGSNLDAYEMDDIRSVYSSVKPASTILSGFPMQNSVYMSPQSPMPFAQPGNEMRQSTYSQHPLGQVPQLDIHGRAMSMGQMSDHYLPQQQLHANPSRSPSLPPGFNSMDNLTGYPSPMTPLNRAGRQNSSGFFARDSSTNLLAPAPVNFQAYPSGQGEASDAQITEAIQACLAVVDLDNVTKKQLKALAEQRLQTQLSAERKAFLDRQIDAELANM